ncbi:RidA family protein [Paraburkholderia caballeronis]|uniref:Enamine deaminase RidA, house cleaning of reactive enamine intermediates, YjgF/YER057c/UK114 family n=1 Tax=Paraburkholderia caballeronis TaxID=416943 RepID=A0A1H7RKH3_9BURK|nr:RidA family protein [Paraburkholderia caballeronis]PXW23084.1 enamine deaminase RidA (YjgF/YER057c/UK114 family) [Paraburkholderia caballeronis]PXW97748.1 enamine deaminase RidA (YjgF/YER057c/UK114 family) [Paraburkholderia caballeronis]RAJ94718.1 enamine deaminase RidA (YjgF/YER057c/UK114 family) [Paraburkholderia caballeronis]TDV27343.1 enamine deaminase RidA (YjgF/YER057c/UK114 family) [Paraburkholderia caballeronis]SEE83098.1 Enamine deaminase RidA, house cleaning of reactive enamine in
MTFPNSTRCYERLRARGLILQPVPTAIGNFQHCVREGSLVFLSGQGPLDERGQLLKGKVGGTVSTEEAYRHAQCVGLNLLSVLHHELGDLSRVKRVVKLFGMVNAVHDFTAHSQVINGCSDLFVDILGDAGRHARSAVGVGSLPGNITVEIEAVIAVHS